MFQVSCLTDCNSTTYKHLTQPFPGECSLENRGSINGWCSSLNALSRGLGPPLSGALFRLGCSLETDTSRLGRYLSFYINMITAAVSWQLFQGVCS